MSPLPAVPEYQDMLKAAALVFLERHHCEHLDNDQQLFNRAVQHLITDYDAQTQIAERSVHLASGDMNAVRDRQRLDVIRSTSTHSVIFDPVSGSTWAVPIGLIYERILNTPDNDRFRVTNS